MLKMFRLSLLRSLLGQAAHGPTGHCSSRVRFFSFLAAAFRCALPASPEDLDCRSLILGIGIGLAAGPLLAADLLEAGYCKAPGFVVQALQQPPQRP